MAITHFIVALLAFQAVCASQPTSLNVDVTRDFAEQWAELIEKFKVAIHEAIQEIIAIGKRIYDVLGEEIKELLEQAKAELKAIVDQVLATIEAIKQEAIELGEAAAQCVIAQQGKIEEINQAAAAGTKTCIDNVKGDADAIIAKAAALIAEGKASLEELVADFKECEGGIFCIGGVILRAKTTVEKFIVDVKAVVAEASAFLVVAIPETRTCITKNLQTHAEAMAVVVADITTCINAIEKEQ